jgi:hypothetical protein
MKKDRKKGQRKKGKREKLRNVEKTQFSQLV